MQIEINRLHAAKGVTSLAAAWDCETPKTQGQAERLGLAFAINFYPDRLEGMKPLVADLKTCFSKQLNKGERALAYSFELQELIDSEDDLYAETLLMMCGLIRRNQFAFVDSGNGALKKLEIIGLW